ncbi:hypothetical protein MXM82_04470 [Pseudomonas asiatica]|uniref:hypothetical protein n=1 Tax=Pseudomonas asiatica TaxID=2219225 RepID=UPI002DB67A41|nr:hypothetical protein [Pseudomonas asiatica]MEB6588393.1 hypothetical protein [Pseudomonas asiatica]
MKYYDLPLRPMQESGAFLLRAMQNEEMPRLDLLVRESVQNGLDAGSKGNAGSAVQINFSLREHSANAIASQLGEGLNLPNLYDRYPGTSRLLEIRDCFTEGLTGPLDFDSIGHGGTHGNLLKLVFEIGRTRGDDGAGGSWGLGKTCYFRMGAGIVIYYSRIRTESGYEERLVASIVEDETRPDRLQSRSRTGIAWWGAEEKLRPLIDSAQIHEVLRHLDIRPFKDEETGTSITIPFLRDDLIPAFEQVDGVSPWWYHSYESYIHVALQRWFSVRLDNRYFVGGPWLAATVNGKPIKSAQMLPVFRVTQALYNRAMSDETRSTDYLELNGVQDVRSKVITPRNDTLRAGSGGVVVAAMLTPDQLGMKAPHNKQSPSLCIFGYEESTAPHRPIVTFMRKPGMSICWDDSVESRGWSGGFAGSPDGRYMIALFVPKAETGPLDATNDAANSSGQSLEGYLRSCERADHCAWVDISGKRIILNIRNACGRFLRDFGLPAAANSTVKPSVRMARNLADLVLLGRGFGLDGRAGKATSSPKPACAGGGGGGRARFASPSPTLDLHDINHLADGISVEWTIRWGTEDLESSREIYVEVDSEGGPISAAAWAESELGQFPFVLKNATAPAIAGRAGACTDTLLIRSASLKGGDTLSGDLMIEVVTSAGRSLRPILGVRLAAGCGGEF